MINGKSKNMVSAIAGFLVVLTISGCGLSGPAHEAPASNVAAVIDMGLMSYTPNNVTIRSGDTIEWRNTSVITHTVTDDSRRAKKSSAASLPSGAQSFDSGDIPAGQVYTHIFTTPGTYRYFCTHHEEHGMVGTVVVKPAL